jgi:hypothetical protein
MPGWVWQPKIDDERAILRVHDCTLFNRHQQPMDRHKARPFARAVEALRSVFAAHRWVDLGLIGWRDKSAFAGSLGAIIVFDLPSPDGDPWEARREWLIKKIPPIELCSGEIPLPGMVYRFNDESQAGLLFARTKGIPGLEGIVGRNLRAPYVQGDSREMAKARWKRG